MSRWTVAPLSLEQREPWAELLGLAFGLAAADMVPVLEALHRAYPVVAQGVWEGGTLAAQYSCLLRQLDVPDRPLPVRVGLSVNMAVHPAYRGQGLVKMAAAPVYEAVRAAGGVAGVGFSNAQGLRVDRRSQGYGYRVVGRLPSTLGLLIRRPPVEALGTADHWPSPPPTERVRDGLVRFAHSEAELAHRYAVHGSRRYRFGTWTEGGVVRGVVAYRWFRRGSLRGASLLAVHGADVDGLVARWARSLWDEGVRLIHTLASPASPLQQGLKRVALTLRLPLSRSPYHLTVKPLGPDMPPSLLDFARWDCVGGDIL